MSNIDFTTEEKTLVLSYAASKDTAFHIFGFYVALAVPCAALAMYGFFHSERVALGLAFSVLVGVWFWRALRELRYLPLHTSIMKKIVEAELGQSAQQGVQRDGPASGGSAR